MNTAPSLKRLMAAFPSLDRDTLAAFRRALQTGGPVRLKFAEDMFGGELLNLRNGPLMSMESRSLAVYFNAGDTYAPTVARYRGSSRWFITTMGDLVERLEARGKRVY